MNRKTLSFLVAFLLLLTLVLIAENRTPESNQERFALDGFIANPDLIAKSSTQLTDPGFDRIELKRGETALKIVKEGTTWVLVEPKRAPVEQHKVKMMLLPLQTPTKSLFSKSAGDDLALYGLDEGNAVHVKVYKEGQLFAEFVAGDTEKSDVPDAGPDEVDTWVIKPGSDNIFRMGGKDLSKAYALELKELRSKKLFTFKKEDISRVTLDDPANATHPRITLVRTNTPPAEEGKPAPSTIADADWNFEPANGLEPGGLNGLLNSIANLRVTDFVSGAEDKKTGLDPADKPYRVHATLNSGDKVEIVVGATDGDKTFATVTGYGEIYHLSTFTAESLRKDLSALRNKKPLNLSAADISRISFVDSKVVLAKKDGEWAVVQPSGVIVGKKAVDTLLKDIEGFAVTSYEPAQGLKEKGLDDASAPSRVIIETTSGDSTTLLISAEQGSVYWAMREGPDAEVWKLTSYMAQKLAGKSADDFRERAIFRFGRDDIAKVELIHSNQTLVLEKNPAATDSATVWKATRGEDVLEKPKSQTINGVLSSLASLQAKSFVREKKAADVGLGEGAFVAKITLASGAKHEVRISEQKLDDQPYASALTAAGWKGQLFTVNPFQAKNIMKKYKDLK